jgi:uncharacterized protein YabN with tetrapyrrole methylase and pyrophosphatase domain
LGKSLKLFLSEAALDPDMLARWLIEPEAAMAAAGIDEQDRELVRKADLHALLARLWNSHPPVSSAKEPSKATLEREAMCAAAALPKGSLVVVGTGIRSVGQLTVEAIAHIKSAQRVFYLVAEPVAEQVVKLLSPAGAQSLADLYEGGKPRRETYREMVERILRCVRYGWRTCAVFYGHPGVFVYPAHEAVRQARAEGFNALMLAAVSAEDCLFADLGLDPSTAGCQSYEATDFLINRRRVDPTSHVILWQVGVLGDQTFSLSVRESNALELLVNALSETYPAEHQLCIYEAAVLPGCKPLARWIPLSRIDKTELSIISTLYLPPSEPPRFDPRLHVAVSWPDLGR